MATQENQSNASEQPRPSREDSGAAQDGGERPSAGDAGNRPGSNVATREEGTVDSERLRKQVADTEAWVQRLREAKAEGTRLSQENVEKPSRREAPQGARSDVDDLVDVLNEGDDKKFVSEMLTAAERRVLNRTTQQQNDMVMSQRVEKIVGDHAPDVPMEMFWHFTEDAIAMAPQDTAKQIEIAIRLSRRALKQRDDRVNSRREANTQNRENAETLDRGGFGPKGGAPDAGNSTLVDEIREQQALRR